MSTTRNVMREIFELIEVDDNLEAPVLIEVDAANHYFNMLPKKVRDTATEMEGHQVKLGEAVERIRAAATSFNQEWRVGTQANCIMFFWLTGNETGHICRVARYEKQEGKE